MTDQSTLADDHAIAGQAKRSHSPDEGEIVEESKRRRDSVSPAPNPSRQVSADGRQFKVVYEGSERSGYQRDRAGHNGRRYDESQRYATRERRYDSRSPQRDRRDWSGYNSGHYHPHKRSRSGRSPGRYSPRSRSISLERRHGTSIPHSPPVSPRDTSRRRSPVRKTTLETSSTYIPCRSY
jgi:hypothetical protein